jgi:hypothetical protein
VVMVMMAHQKEAGIEVNPETTQKENQSFSY